MFVTVVPAYGRDYTSGKAAKADWDANKDFIIAFSKADLMDQELLEEFKTILKQEFKEMEYHIISSVSTFGIDELKEDLWNKLNQKN